MLSDRRDSGILFSLGERKRKKTMMTVVVVVVVMMKMNSDVYIHRAHFHAPFTDTTVVGTLIL